MNKLIGTQNVFDDVFVLVEASKLKMDDEIVQYEPVTEHQVLFKAFLKYAINQGVKDFYHPIYDPSYDEEKKQLCFAPNRLPLLGGSFNEWELLLSKFLPERGSRIGTKNEYVVFLGILIKKLVESGWSLADAWYAVCNDSRELGHYKNAIDAKLDFEKTGSREVCGFFDLANTYKYLQSDEEYKYWVAGGTFDAASNRLPIARLVHHINRGFYSFDTVPWVVLER